MNDKHAQYDGISNSYCAYNRWFLNWKVNKQFTISALDAGTNTEVDFTDNNAYTITNNPEGALIYSETLQNGGCHSD